MTIALFDGKHHLDRRALDLIEAANEGSDDELKTTPQTAVWLGVSPEWLEIGRTKGWGPPFVRLSPRRVRYRVGDVKQWLTERAHRSTAEYADPKAPPQGRRTGSRVVDGRVVLLAAERRSNASSPHPELREDSRTERKEGCRLSRPTPRFGFVRRAPVL